VHHYGISWTPSSMEQRIGRVDRVRSQTDRRLSALTAGPPNGDDKLQVYFPHLADTVEVLQVKRVLDRMNVFLRLMHEGLVTARREERTINTDEEFALAAWDVQQIMERLRSAFPVRPEQIQGDVHELAVGPGIALGIAARFETIRQSGLPGLNISWDCSPSPSALLGTAHLGKRVQPFTLLLKSLGSRPLVRCVSPVGYMDPSEDQESLVESVAGMKAAKMGVIVTDDEATYDLTVESDVLLSTTPETDAQRVAQLVSRVVMQADALEQEYFEGRDEVLDTFRDDLLQEGNHGR